MKNIKILLVDDEPAYLKSLSLALRGLKKYGFEPEIFQADNLEGALGVLDLNKIDLVITDGQFFEKKQGYPLKFLGNKLAFEAGRKLIPIIGMSAAPKSFQPELFDVIFKKPVEIMELIKKIIKLEER